MPRRFHGGIHTDGKKELTLAKSIERIAPPERVVLPVSMHIGAPAKPMVAAGDRVLLGQLIADSDQPVSAPVHASVSGTVAAVEPRPHPNGSDVLSIVIDNDFKDELSSDVRPRGSYESLTAEEITALVRACGIVGLGGATFPSHIKISSGAGKVDTLIINGAECEGYITSDYRAMLESPGEIVSGTRALMKVFGLDWAVIAVESNKLDAVKALRAVIPAADRSVRVQVLPTRYPQGAEKQIIRSVTGREVPPGGLPAAVGCAVFNVITAQAVHRAITAGMPLVSRVVTVSGGAVSNPKNLLVPLGTPLTKLIEACGGLREAPQRILMGGPMMGVAQYNLESPVIKATNALLALDAKECRAFSNPVCIRCGRCVAACPVNLMPALLYMYGRAGDTDALRRYNVADCIECGCCSYVCPGGLQLVQALRLGKQISAPKK